MSEQQASKPKLISVRFTKDGRGYDPETKYQYSAGTNVIYQRVYWDVPEDWARKIAKEHDAKMVRCD